jgi:hypothetical protein
MISLQLDPASDEVNSKIVKVFNFEIPEWFEWIASFSNFRSTHWNNWKIPYRLATFTGLLESIQSYLWWEYYWINDPIQYIAYLYYDEWSLLSISDIDRRLNNVLWPAYPYKGKKSSEVLRKRLVHTLWWELRDDNEVTPLRIAKNKQHAPNLKSQRLEQLDSLRQTCKSELEKLLTPPSSPPMINYQELNIRKWKLRKFIYVLSITWWIEEYAVLNIIVNLGETSASDTIAHVLWEELSRSAEETSWDITIDRNGIEYIRTRFDHNSLNVREKTRQLIDLSSIPWYWQEFRLNYSLVWFQWISSMSELESRTRLWYIYKKMWDLSSILKQIYPNPVDPIQFLIYLYYQKRWAVKDLHEKLSSLWLNWSASTIYENLRDLGWKLNDPTKPSEHTRKKISRARK